MNIIDLKSSNDIVSDLISSGKSFALGRLGIGEAFLFYNVVNGIKISDGDILKFKNFGGVYGDCFDQFTEEYLDAMKNMDFHCYWKGMTKELDDKQDDLYAKIGMDGKIMPFEVVEPYYCDIYKDMEIDAWSKHLKGKKVLVINPFAKSIASQYSKKRELIWENPDILPEFKLIAYRAVQSIGDLYPHSSWVESLSVMKEDISKIDFDIALLGCGCYGLPLCSFIKKELGKSAIYVGGAVQIMFGVRGSRWDMNPNINRFYNSEWVRPSMEETPRNFRILEGGCYW